MSTKLHSGNPPRICASTFGRDQLIRHSILIHAPRGFANLIYRCLGQRYSLKKFIPLSNTIHLNPPHTREAQA